MLAGSTKDKVSGAALGGAWPVANFIFRAHPIAERNDNTLHPSKQEFYSLSKSVPNFFSRLRMSREIATEMQIDSHADSATSSTDLAQIATEQRRHTFVPV